MSGEKTSQAPTTEELLGLPIDRLSEGIVAVAERLAASHVRLYVVDLEGVALRRLAGGFSMPEEVPIPQMAGSEIPAGHLDELERSFAARGLGTVVPLWLRHRAIAVFLVEGPSPRALEEFAAGAAVAASLLTHGLSHVTGLHETPLDDDATVMVLAVLGDRTHEPSANPPDEVSPEPRGPD